MTFDEAVKRVLEIFPNALFDDSVDGEILISTGMMIDKEETLIPYEEGEET